jgi:hypothetical protein
MALIKCKECEKEISSDAVNCPSCGAPVKPIKKKGGFLNYLKKMVITLVVIMTVFYAGFLYVKDAVQEKVAADKIEKVEKAKLKAIEDKKKAEEKKVARAAKEEVAARAAKEEVEKLEKNLENAKYLRKIAGTISEISCKNAIEKQAKYDFEWTDRLYKFPSYLVETKAPGILTLVGDKIKMQNAMGAMRFMKYHCDYDIRDKEVLAVRVFPR